jgi:hypothetical protein
VTFPYGAQPGPRPTPPPGGFRPGPPPTAPQPHARPEPHDAGQPHPGQSHPGQPHPGQSHGGQPHGGQSHGGASQGGLPHGGGPHAPVRDGGTGEDTGHPAVDAVLRSLANAARLAPAEQIAEYEAAHQVLQETLASIDR